MKPEIFFGYCTNCKKIVLAEENHCPDCYWAISYEESADYFTKIKLELDEIINKWKPSIYYLEQSRRFPVILDEYRKYIFKITDLGHQPGSLTIKRNFDLSELAGNVSSQIIIAGFCLGLEYGFNEKQPIPIVNETNIPDEVSDFFLITYFQTDDLHTRLLEDISRVGILSEDEMSELFNDYFAHFIGQILTVYKLGLATAREA